MEPSSPSSSLKEGMDERKEITPQQVSGSQIPLFGSQIAQQSRVAFSPNTPSARRTRNDEGTPVHSSIRSPSNVSSLRRGDLGRSHATMVPATPFSPNQFNENVVPSSQVASRFLSRITQNHSSHNSDGLDEIPRGLEEEDEHELMLSDDAAGLLASVTAASTEVRIWGTEINAHSFANIFRYFLENFGRKATEPLTSSYYFKQLLQLKKKRRLQGPTGENQLILNVNCEHFLEFPSTHHFYHQVVQHPQESIQILDSVVNDEYRKLADQDNLEEGSGELIVEEILQTRLFGLKEICRLRSLNPENIEQLISLKGMVIRVAPIVPDLKLAFLRCSICHHVLQIGVENGRIDEPNSCPSCQSLASLEMIYNRCTFADKQMIRLQETPDEIPEGETPQTITLFAYDDLVDSVRPGDRLEVTGIFRALQRRVNPRLRTVKAVFRTFVDVIHFRRSGFHHEERMMIPEEQDENDIVAMEADLSHHHHDNEEGPFLDETDQQEVTTHQQAFNRLRIQEFRQFGQSRNVEERLVKSFAPSIWEMDDVKKGLLCLLFGGTKRRKASARRQPRSTQNSSSSSSAFEERKLMDEDEDGAALAEDEADAEDDENGTHHRGDINILLCGDPGTSKSQLLGYVHKLTPRGIYTSGKGSSAVGLTASVVKDPETREYVLESGALVLSDNGICCIDEFDKMSEQTRAILHEAMEQQTVSITKAGIIATLNARTSILASANPVQSRYNPRLSVVDNIKLPPTLLSRFDLIYLILDKPNPDTDRRLANHLVSLYCADEEDLVGESEDDGVIRWALDRGGRGGEGGEEDEGGEEKVEPVDQSFLKEYILYARNHVFPEISDEAEELLVNNYVQMRSLGHASGGGGSGGKGMKIITATPRQLESLIRLSQALAKMHLSNLVTRENVQEATRLMKVATQTAATDPRTGTIDMDLISTGRTALNRDLITKLAEEMKHIFHHCRIGDRFTLSQLRQRIQSSQANDYRYGGGRYRGGEEDSSSILGSLTLIDIEDAARKLESDGAIQYLDRTQTIIIRNNSGGGGGGGGEGRGDGEENEYHHPQPMDEED